jgi:hypothetical protein
MWFPFGLSPQGFGREENAKVSVNIKGEGGLGGPWLLQPAGKWGRGQKKGDVCRCKCLAVSPKQQGAGRQVTPDASALF